MLQHLGFGGDVGTEEGEDQDEEARGEGLESTLRGLGGTQDIPAVPGCEPMLLKREQNQSTDPPLCWTLASLSDGEEREGTLEGAQVTLSNILSFFFKY